jgi:hypothetical protein
LRASEAVHAEIVGIDGGEILAHLVGYAEEGGIDQVFFPQIPSISRLFFL